MFLLQNSSKNCGDFGGQMGVRATSLGALWIYE